MDVEKAFLFLETHSVREVVALVENASRDRLWKLKYEFPKRYAALLERKRLKKEAGGATYPSAPVVRKTKKLNSIPRLKEKENQRFKNTAPQGELTDQKPRSGVVPKAGLAFLQRALKYAPGEAARREQTVRTVVFGLYLEELCLRLKHGQRSRELKNVFGINVRTAQRHRRLGLAVTRESGLHDACLQAISSNGAFPNDLLQKIAKAVGQMSLRQLYVRYSII